MASTLQQAQESRQAMTADIAHELRTPLSIQRANLEALQDGVYPLNLENLEPIIQQNHLLTQLVEDLRTFSPRRFRNAHPRSPTDQYSPLTHQYL